MSKFWKITLYSILSVLFLGFIFTYSIFAGVGISTVRKNNSTASAEAIEIVEEIVETSPEEKVVMFADEEITFSYFLDKEKYFSLTTEQLTKVLNDACKIISLRYLSLESVDTVEVYYDTNCTYNGYHKGDKIRINLYNIAKAKQEHQKILETLAHEIRHDFQEEQVSKGYENALTDSYKNYVSSKTDYDAYYSQLAEQDARLFATYMVNYVKTAYKTK